MSDDLGAKVVVVFYPREKKLSKGEIASEAVIGAMMALMSAADHSSVSDVRLKLAFDPGDKSRSVAGPWFADGSSSRFKVEIKRAIDTNAYNTLYHWCSTENVPAFRGELGEQGSCLVIGPYWSVKIDELLGRAFIEDESLREYETSRPDKESDQAVE